MAVSAPAKLLRTRRFPELAPPPQTEQRQALMRFPQAARPR